MAVTRGTYGGLNTTSSNATFAINSNWFSASTVVMGISPSSWGSTGTGGYSWTVPDVLDETQVKSLKHILTLASASDDELTDIADSLAASTGDTPVESLKVLRTVRALVLLGQLAEKLAR